MKKSIIITIFILCSIRLFAYEREETLISGNIESSGFGAPVARYTQIDGKWGLMFGGRGGWIINHTFVIGGAGYGLVANNIKSDVADSAGGTLNYMLSYGGPEFEYIIESDDLVHATVGVLLGLGNTGFVSRNDAMRATDTSSFYIIEPGMNVELNVSKHFRIDIGVYYRLVSGVDSINLSNEKVNSPTVNLAFKFGKF